MLFIRGLHFVRPKKVLLSSLATTDFCVGLISEPLYITLLVTVLHENWNICLYLTETVFVTSTILCGASLFTLIARSDVVVAA